ncbi:hypothetical protein F856_gp02 [Enterobacteria phage vB_EcoS_Rogue1]|uniref:Uncharacterized protein n=1 Tax=Enterobacteria phage vB_EcoS_Rogue1 TaxID=1147155 RepID=K7PHU9_9CAUD|nr:hypothetical protein F856_gp02 [Enterobacteria phage vB_EcoS_Rogue1]AFM76554.1 hypothetical protein Rogue1_002 [Enterobacteria phage vB_EcoS_Rogue1]
MTTPSNDAACRGENVIIYRIHKKYLDIHVSTCYSHSIETR